MDKIQDTLRTALDELQNIPERIREVAEPDWQKPKDDIANAEYHFHEGDYEMSKAAMEDAKTGCADIIENEGLTTDMIEIIKYIEKIPFDDIETHVDDLTVKR